MLRTRKLLGLIAFPFLLSFTLASRCTSLEETEELAKGVGKTALEITKTILAFGPRPSGGERLGEVRAWIRSEVESMGLEFSEDRFVSETPIGTIPMANLHFRIPGKDGLERVVLMAHYETKRFDTIEFLGANDATSSFALILALVPIIEKLSFPFDVEVVLVDGEEAFVEWSEEDSLYGSRHFAANLKGKKSIRAAVVLDMIGDRELKYIRNATATAEYIETLEEILLEMNRLELLDTKSSFVLDDHIPLIGEGIKTLHLMDFTFGGKGSPGIYWHTEADTLDKISASSLETTAEIVLRFLNRLRD